MTKIKKILKNLALNDSQLSISSIEEGIEKLKGEGRIFGSYSYLHRKSFIKALSAKEEIF